jgi:hypothetical protein
MIFLFIISGCRFRRFGPGLQVVQYKSTREIIAVGSEDSGFCIDRGNP